MGRGGAAPGTEDVGNSNNKMLGIVGCMRVRAKRMSGSSLLEGDWCGDSGEGSLQHVGRGNTSHGDKPEQPNGQKVDDRFPSSHATAGAQENSLQQVEKR